MDTCRLMAIAVAMLSSCALPRSGLLMMGADRVGAGNAEVGLATGVAFSAQSTAGVTSTQLQLPTVEANGRLGLTDWADANLHLGANGIQPGLKLGMKLGPLELVGMPTVAFGLFRADASGRGASSSNMLFNFETGLRLMASHELGAYAGVGYWFQFSSLAGASGPSEGGLASASITGHNLAFNVGWRFKAGPVQLRPELCVLVLAGSTLSSGGQSVGQGPQITLMPALTAAIGSH